MSLCDQLEQQTETSLAAHTTLVENLLATLTSSTDAAELEQSLTGTALPNISPPCSPPKRASTSSNKPCCNWRSWASWFPRTRTMNQLLHCWKKSPLKRHSWSKRRRSRSRRHCHRLGRMRSRLSCLLGWGVCRFGNIFQELKYGTSQKSDYGIDGAPVLRIPNVVKGYVESSDLKFSNLSEQDVEQYSLREGDLLPDSI